ncbi:MAG: hypothetical protein HUJ96_07060 [Marinilabiliaceae bacterium]|nr:hypothetical protein [Marinilabiliaceae bacterium]
MNKVLLLLSCLVTFCSCAKYPVERATGLDNQAYILFIGGELVGSDEVRVTLDEKVFPAKAIKAKKSDTKGITYAVQTGKRKLKVEHKGVVVYEKVVYLSNQETKKIELP